MITPRYFEFNPLYLLFTDCYPPSRDSEKKNPFDPSVRQMKVRESVAIELQMAAEPNEVELREKFKEIFREFIVPFEEIEVPIALVTFVLSILIAIKPELRQILYSQFKGRIPAITAFCLIHFRPSYISDSEYVKGFYFHNEYWDTHYCMGLGNTIFNLNTLKEGPMLFLLWFSFLNEHFSSEKKEGQENYLNWVEFEPIPAVSTDQKNYLCGLTVEDNKVICSESSYFHELPKEKQIVFETIAVAIDSICRLLDVDIPDPHKDLFNRHFDDWDIILDLIEFIVTGCKDYLAKNILKLFLCC